MKTDLDHPPAQTAVSSETPPDRDQSVFMEWLEHLFEDYFNLFAYWRQRRAILEDPSITLRRNRARMRKGPFLFAMQAQVALFAIGALSVTCIVQIVHLPPPSDERSIAEYDRELAEIQRSQQALDVEAQVVRTLEQPAERRRREAALVQRRASMRARDDARVRELRDRRLDKQVLKKCSDLIQGSANLLVGASLLIAATLFRRNMKRLRTDFPAAGEADRIYLYFISACLLVPNVMSAAASVVLELTDRTTRSDALQELSSVVWVAMLVWSAIIHWRAGGTISRLMGLPEGTPVFGKMDGPRFVSGRLVRAYAASMCCLIVGVSVAWSAIYWRESRAQPPLEPVNAALVRTSGGRS